MGFAVTAQQVGLMAVFIVFGLFGAKKKWISDQAATGLTNILIYFVTPGVILQAFNRPFSMSRLHELGIVTLVVCLAFPVMTGLAYLIYLKVPDLAIRRDLRFSLIYSNAGFLGIPLSQALLGPDGVFFAVIFMVPFNIFVWTQGWSMYDSRRTGPIKRLFSNPAIPAVIVGIALFLAPVSLPSIVVTGLNYLAGMNAPLAMFVVGVSLARVRWRTFASDPWIWLGTAMRNLLIPIVGILALWLVPLSIQAKLGVLIPLSCPVATFLVMFAVTHKVDSDFAARLVSLSTLVSILSLPATVSVASSLWS
ncbi:MAG: AEC family transporter [Propionibacteriaceae bacterium]|nr:AEC family transporter [Propionibacteriaceae bacterium]